MRSKKVKVLISGILAFFIISTGIYVFSLLPKSEHNNYRRYLWVFQDAARKNVDTLISFGTIGEEDIEYSYIYNNDYYVDIWEFFSLKGSALSDINISENIDLSGETIPFSIVSHSNRQKNPIITRKLGFVFKNKMNVLVSDNSEIIKNIISINYKGFIGKIDRVCLSDDEGNPFVLLDWPGKDELTLFLLCKKDDRFYIIIVNSNLVFDESIINIFNVK